MSEILDYEEAIRPFLSEKRYHHSLCVAEAAEELARQYGADEEKAWIAGILHDILKETPGEEQLRMLDGFGIALTDLERSAPKLWHAITGAAYLEHTLHIQDREILDAVRYHTTGRADMTLLEKILFVADYTSADRQFDGVDRLRSLARKGWIRPSFWAPLLRLRIWPICIRRSIPIRWRHTTGMSCKGRIPARKIKDTVPLARRRGKRPVRRRNERETIMTSLELAKRAGQILHNKKAAELKSLKLRIFPHWGIILCWPPVPAIPMSTPCPMNWNSSSSRKGSIPTMWKGTGRIPGSCSITARWSCMCSPRNRGSFTIWIAFGRMGIR